MRNKLLLIVALPLFGGTTLYAQQADSPSRRVEIVPSFTEFAKGYVVGEINRWQKKGQFEKTVMWKQRVNEQTRKAKIKEFTQIAEKQFIEKMSASVVLNLSLKSYDADSEVWLVTDPVYGNMLVKVPIDDAQEFQTRWNTIEKSPVYMIDNDQLAIAKVNFTLPNGQTYAFNSAASLSYNETKIDYDFAPIEIDYEENNQRGNQLIAQQNLSVRRSDVDVNIPTTTMRNDNTFVMLIANENYDKFSSVEYALNDSKVFKEYCEKTLGVPSENILYYPDATYGMMRAAMDDIRKIVTAWNGDCKVVAYYAGHGAPDPSTEKAYLVPTDANRVNPYICYALDDFNRDLESLNAKSVVLFLDACFSGYARSEAMLEKGGRGVAIVAKSGQPKGKLLVFSAASRDEMAMPYRDKGHGLFTYYLLKKLQESQGDVTYGQLADYLKDQIRKQSVRINRSGQTPNIMVGSGWQGDWKEMPLR